MLVTSIFYFSHNVLKRILSQDPFKSGLCGKDLTLYHTIPNYHHHFQKKPFENFGGRGENAGTTIFSTPSKTNSTIYVIFRLNPSRILSLGIEFMTFQKHCLIFFQNVINSSKDILHHLIHMYLIHMYSRTYYTI